MQKHCLKSGNTHQAGQAQWALNSVYVASNALSTMVNLLNVLPTGFASNSGCILPQRTAQKLRRINNEISPGATYLHSGNGKCVCGRKNSLRKCADNEKTRSFFVISIASSFGHSIRQEKNRVHNIPTQRIERNLYYN